MREIEARQVAEKIRNICKEHGLWCIIEEQHKPELKMILVKEISIKVDNQNGRL